MAPKLTIITHVYNAQAGIDMQTQVWRSYPDEVRKQLEFIVIDDFSDPPLKVDRNDLNLRLLRVDDDIDWNMAGCRNLAAIHAASPWLLYFDCDNIASAANLTALLGGLQLLDPRKLYVFGRAENGQIVEPHINSFLLARTSFFAVGGYDEDFVGHYGYEDVLFRNLWRRSMDGEVLLTDIVFKQMGWRTETLNRDLERNKALIEQKALQGFRKPVGLVRFNWHEVGLS
jgi:hypothetical protein